MTKIPSLSRSSWVEDRALDVQWGIDNLVALGGINQCAAKIATAFILDPTTALDLGCVKDTPTLSFVLPDGSMSQ